jgi:hypothetical protein
MISTLLLLTLTALPVESGSGYRYSHNTPKSVTRLIAVAHEIPPTPKRPFVGTSPSTSLDLRTAPWSPRSYHGWTLAVVVFATMGGCLALGFAAGALATH